MFGIFKRYRQFKQVRAIVEGIEEFEKRVDLIRDGVSLKECINELIETYNEANRAHISKTIIDMIYELAISIRAKDYKKGSLKHSLAKELIAVLLDLTGSIVKKLIWRALIKI